MGVVEVAEPALDLRSGGISLEPEFEKFDAAAPAAPVQVAAPLAAAVQPVAPLPAAVHQAAAYYHPAYFYAAPYTPAYYGYQQPAAAAVVDTHAAAVISPVTSQQYHAQSEIGEYNYGYSNPTGAKAETRTVDGVVRGTYSYVDANGIVQTANYIADDLFGFRVAATNLPVAPAVPEVVEAEQPVVVEE